MNRLLIFLITFTAATSAQTVYLRSGGPASTQIIGATNATPIVITTATDTGFTGGETVGIHGTCMNGGASPMDGFRKVMTSPAPTHTAPYTFAISDLSGTPIAGTGAWCDGSGHGNAGGPQWVGKVTSYTLGTEPLGWLDGPNGNLMRKLSLGPLNGLTSLVVSGASCTAGGTNGCTLTATTSYDPTAATPPMAAGNSFSVWGTGTILDSTNARSCAGAGGTGVNPIPYAVASVSSSGWTATFTCSGLATGSYTNEVTTCGPAATPNDTIGGSQSCTRLSQLVYAGNPMFNNMVGYISLLGMETSGNSYMSAFDAPGVGTRYPNPYEPSYQQDAAIMFLVDQSNALLFRDLNYYFNHVDHGTSWIANEQISNAGLSALDALGVYVGDVGLGLIYDVYAPYTSSANKTAWLDKIYNDVDDPTNVCSKNGVEANSTTGVNTVITSGTAQATTATSITLASSASGSNSFYNGYVVCGGTGTPSALSCATISGYTGSTKVVTFSSWSGSTPASNTPYSVFATVTWSSLTAGVSVTVTGLGTKFVTGPTPVGVGGYILGANSWPIDGNWDLGSTECYVTAVTDDTHLTCVNGQSVSNGGASTNAGTVLWQFPPWGSTNCGMIWGMKHSQEGGMEGVQPAIYPPNAGSTIYSGGIPLGGNQTASLTMNRMSLDFAAAPDDSRAVRDLGAMQSFAHDYNMGHYMAYGTGWVHSGSSLYSSGTARNNAWYVWVLGQSVPSFPSMVGSGAWLADPALYNMYTTYPDVKDYGDSYGPSFAAAVWGAQGTPIQIEPYSTIAQTYVTPANFWFAPTSNTSAYYKNWATSAGSFSLFANSANNGSFYPQTLLYIDPRIPSSNYQAQPLQYLFGQNNNNLCTSLTASPYCLSGLNGLAMISRTSWSNYNGGSARNGTFLKCEARGFAGDHDNPEPGCSIYKVGDLVNTDSPTGGPYGFQGQSADLTVLGASVQFGGLQPNLSYEFNLAFNYTNPFTYGTTALKGWASANKGSWDLHYGDQNSRYAVMCADTAGMYLSSWNINYAQDCTADLKKSGNDQFILEWVTVLTSTSTSSGIAKHIHYTQNGQQPPYSYTTGTTACPGSGGCASLNTNRVMQELEDGSGPDTNPKRQYGLVSNFLSPSTITLRDDCVGHGGGQCAPGDTYPGGNGYTHRISLCAGSSCGAAASSFKVLIIHKVAQSLSDTSLTSTAITPDSNWFGAQVCGATSCGVGIFAQDNQTHSTMTGFTTTHSGTAQYVFAGLTPNTYTVTVNGSAVTGSPFTVAAGDTTLYFESAAGAVAITAGAQACSISTTAVPAGVVGTPYSTTLQTANCTAPVTWRVTAGTLCNGLLLDGGSGMLFGTPSTVQDCNFTVQANDSGGNAPTQLLTQSISGSSALSSISVMSSGAATTAGTIRH